MVWPCKEFSVAKQWQHVSCRPSSILLVQWLPGMLPGIICVHVDDFLWAGVADFENDIVNNLSLTFKIGKEETERVLNKHNQCEDDITIDNESYINHLKPIDISPDR